MFRLEMETENDAFDAPGYEIARILRGLANRVSVDVPGRGSDGQSYTLRDANGNKVGEARWMRDDS